MKNLQTRILILTAFLILLSSIVFVVNNILSLSNLLAAVHPTLGTLSRWLLLGLTCLCVFYLAGSYFLRQKPLVLPEGASPERAEVYLASIRRRLNRNRELTSRGMRVQSANDVAGAIALLDGLAEEETKQVAKRVFVSTAVAQNGRLDSVIVFYQIAVLIWRISRIYDQRPYPHELWKIYGNVLATSMVSFGIEQVDLTDQIGSLVSPLFAHSILDHVPVVKTFTKAFTHAILTGSANAGLVCRVGVVAKNYMKLKTEEDLCAESRPTLEATRMLNGISSEAVQKVLSALAGSIKGMTAQGTRKATDSLFNAAGAAVQGVADAGGIVGGRTREAYRTTRDGAKSLASSAVRTTRKGVGRIRKSAGKVGAIFSKNDG